MAPSQIHFFPLRLLFIILLILLLGLVVAMIEIGALRYAYEKIGIGRHYVFALLFMSLLGSYVNIPVTELPAERVLSDQEVWFFGIGYVVPFAEKSPRTVVAVNLGGAVIPVLVSFYLVLINGAVIATLIAVLIVTLIVHRVARPLRGVGIAVPLFVPPLIAAAAALLLAPAKAPALAYTAGTLGTLIGGDLLNLGKLRGLGAPVVSIGGAGTFDGVFLSGIIAVLLA
jgi:uncharacterized membrane protein